MKVKKQQRYTLPQSFKGSYTVEAALLMGIVLSVLTAVIYLGFLMHDRGFLQGAAHEAACAASLHKDNDTDISALANALIANRMLAASGVRGSAVWGEKDIAVQYCGDFQIPGMIRALFGGNRIQLKSRAALMTERPSKRIQKIRGLVKIARRVRNVD